MLPVPHVPRQQPAPPRLPVDVLLDLMPVRLRPGVPVPLHVQQPAGAGGRRVVLAMGDDEAGAAGHGALKSGLKPAEQNYRKTSDEVVVYGFE